MVEAVHCRARALIAHKRRHRRVFTNPPIGTAQGWSAMTPTAALAKTASSEDCWRGFKPGDWRSAIDVRDFIVRNVTPYDGDEKFPGRAIASAPRRCGTSFSPISRTSRRRACSPSTRKTPSTLLAHKPGYIDRDNEVIVGLQTDQPFKRAIFPYGGLRMVEAGLKAAGLRGRSAGPRGVHEVPQDRTTTACSTPIRRRS